MRSLRMSIFLAGCLMAASTAITAFGAVTAVTAAKPAKTAKAAKTATPASAAVLDLAQGDNSVEFLAVGRPGALKIHGTTDTSKVKQPLTGSLKVAGVEITGTASYSLDALDTGIEMRTHHMKEKYLQTDKYPTATLKLTSLKLSADFAKAGDASKSGIDFSGDLTLHGVTKPVKGTADVARNGEKYKLSLSFPVVLTDYNIDIPSFMGVTVAKDVTATAKVETKIQHQVSE